MFGTSRRDADSIGRAVYVGGIRGIECDPILPRLDLTAPPDRTLPVNRSCDDLR